MQFPDGQIVAPGHYDTTIAAAVSGQDHSEVWLWDPRRRATAQQLLRRDEHHSCERAVHAMLPGGTRLVVGVRQTEGGGASGVQLRLAMDWDGRSQVDITAPIQGHHYGSHLSPAGAGRQRLASNVALRSYAILAFELVENSAAGHAPAAASGGVRSRAVVQQG